VQLGQRMFDKDTPRGGATFHCPSGFQYLKSLIEFGSVSFRGRIDDSLSQRVEKYSPAAR
jgi:hypothetical protein